MLPVQRDHYERIARMHLMEVPLKQIAAVCNLSESRISQIIESDENYAGVQSEIAASVIESQGILNQSWDMVESLGVNAVFEALRHNPDPDFALRAAAIANRANRRGGNQAIPVGQAGVRAVITLNATFAERLQQNFQVNTGSMAELPEKKATNFLSSGSVEKLLANGKEKLDNVFGRMIPEMVEN
jgi:hypothetical protein